MNPVIDLRDLAIGSDTGVRILQNITWRVARGEHWVMLGPNGSGKTTLLGALTGYIPDSTGVPTGHMEVLGGVYGESDWRELRKTVGLVSATLRHFIADDTPVLDLVAGGQEALLFVWKKLSPAVMREARTRLAETDCAHIADRRWGVISQGERQRVLIARALMAHPRLLILDEPCAGLDPVSRTHFLDFISRLARRAESPTILLVTHHVEEITPEFTHALLLRAGTVHAAGPIKNTLTAKNLTEIFAAPIRLAGKPGTYRLNLAPSGR